MAQQWFGQDLALLAAPMCVSVSNRLDVVQILRMSGSRSKVETGQTMVVVRNQQSAATRKRRTDINTFSNKSPVFCGAQRFRIGHSLSRKAPLGARETQYAQLRCTHSWHLLLKEPQFSARASDRASKTTVHLDTEIFIHAVKIRATPWDSEKEGEKCLFPCTLR
eukprot:Polyplicarium_translucidae@DN1310_c0_g1_i2.p1